MVGPLDKFHEKYEQPQINDATVGFSGIDPAVRAVNPADISHEELGSLLGGDEQGHFHLTQDELEKLQQSPARDELNSVVKHERLSDLLGGDANGHFHLTQNELEKVQNVINTFTLEDEDTQEIKIQYPIQDHEQLNNLKGGMANEHYHFTLKEWQRLRKIIEVLFPNGATDPVFPNVPSGDDSGGNEPEDLFGGLPRSTPPLWTQLSNRLPDKYTWYVDSVDGYVHKTYCRIQNSIPTLTVFAFIQYNEEKSRIFSTQNGTSWTKFANAYVGNDYNDEFQFRFFSQYINISGVTFFLGHHGHDTYHGWIFYIKDGDWKHYSLPSKVKNNASKPFTSGAYSDSLQRLFLFNVEGQYVRCTTTSSKPLELERNTTVETISGIRVTAGCAAYNKVNNIICVAGKNGTAASTDGINWTKNTNAPKDIMTLEYREDLQCFFAFGRDSKLFYHSTNGINWSNVNSTPAPCDNVMSVNYNPDLQWYCVIGGTSQYVYFSKDLEHWVASQVTVLGDVSMGNIVWLGGGIKKYMLLPTGGTTYYMFDPAEWTD